MKKLRKIAGGETYTLIYLKMMLLSIANNGVLEYQGVEESLEKELAFELDEDADNIKVTINFLISVNLAEYTENGSLVLLYAMENIGSETDSAKRVREYRERKALHCNSVVTTCNTEKRERREEKEEDIEIDKRKSIDYQQIADMYNNTCVSFHRIKSLSDARKKAIKARLRTYTVDDFKTMFERAEASDFLKGCNNRNWSPTFDWMIKDVNMAKILDGNYDNKENRQQQIDDWYGV